MDPPDGYIYSLGVVFYEMLTGRLPLGRFPSPSEKVECDPGVDHVVLKSLEHEPDERYQRAAEMRGDVERLGSEPASAPRSVRAAPAGGAVPPERYAAPAAVPTDDPETLGRLRRLYRNLAVVGFAILVVSFLPWGTISGAPTMSIDGGPGTTIFPGSVTMYVNVLDGRLTLYGLVLPNWMHLLVSAAIGGLGLAGLLSRWRPPRLPLVALGAAGAFFAGFWLVLFLVDAGGRVLPPLPALVLGYLLAGFFAWRLRGPRPERPSRYRRFARMRALHDHSEDSSGSS